MTEIKHKLRDLVEVTIIPEVEEYLEELSHLLEQNKATDDDMDAIREMESYLVELQNVVLAINEYKIDDEQAEEIYNNLMRMIEEHQHGHEEG